MLRITVFAFLALAVLACSRPEPDSVTQLRWVETADPIADAKNALALGDYRVRAVDGFVRVAPGMNTPDERAYVERYGMNPIVGTSDMLESEEHPRLNKLAERYAERYNAYIYEHSKR